MDDIKFNRLKGYYTDASPSEGQVDAFWQEFSEKIPHRQYHKHHYTFRHATIFATLTIFFAAAMILGVQAAGPSSPLYPVREFSETASAKLSGKYDSLIEYRTDAIINAAQKKSDSEIRKAALEYQLTLIEAQQKKQQTKEAEKELKETLRASEQKLKSVTTTSKEAKNALKESIQAAKETRKEVKGESTGPGNSGNIKNNAQPSPTPKPEASGNSGNAGGNSNSGGNSSNPTSNGSANSGNPNVPQNPGQSGESHGNSKN